MLNAGLKGLLSGKMLKFPFMSVFYCHAVRGMLFGFYGTGFLSFINRENLAVGTAALFPPYFWV